MSEIPLSTFDQFVLPTGNGYFFIEFEGVAWLTEEFKLTMNIAKRAIYRTREKALIALDLSEQLAAT